MRDVFIGSAALASGRLTRGQLRWNYRPLFPDVYLSKVARPHFDFAPSARGCGRAATA